MGEVRATPAALKLERVSHQELSAINIGGTGRAPLVAHFRRRTGGEEFLFVVNHLFRGNATARRQQATALNAWAAAQTLPVVAASSGRPSRRSCASSGSRGTTARAGRRRAMTPSSATCAASRRSPPGGRSKTPTSRLVTSGDIAFLTPLATPNVRVAVLHSEKVPPSTTNCAYRINDASIVLLVEIDTYRFLLTGDANGKEYDEDVPGHVEAQLLRIESQRPGTLKVDVLKVPHHGSETASTTAFIEKVQPTFAVISASTRHHLPKKTVVERYEDAGAIVLRTDVDVENGVNHIICYPTAEGTVDCSYRSVLFPDE